MTRIDTKKVLFVGLKKSVNPFFNKAQDVGLIHFSGIGEKSVRELSSHARLLVSAHKVLRTLIPVAQVEPEDLHRAYIIAKDILDINNELINLEEKKRKTSLEKARIEVFGDFSIEDMRIIEKESGKKIEFYFSKQAFFKKEELPFQYIYINSDHGLDYYCSIGKNVPPLAKMIPMHFDKSLSTLEKELKDIEYALLEHEERLKAHAKYDKFLHNALLHTLDQDALLQAKDAITSHAEDALFAIEAWVPANKLEELNCLVEDFPMQIEDISPKENEIPPTYLENKGIPRIGEDLVHIYDTPSNTDKDPSLWVLVAFALFFAMIIGDGGYGILFFLSALYFQLKMKKSSSAQKRAFSLSYILFGACIIWGGLTHSFFGIEPGIDSPLRKISLIQYLVEKKASYHIKEQDVTYSEWVKKYPDIVNAVNAKEFLKAGQKKKDSGTSYEILDKFSDQVKMEIALLVGVIHITLSLLRYAHVRYASIGWTLFLIGGYVYAPEYLGGSSIEHYVLGISHETAKTQGLWLMKGGFILACFFSLLQNKIYGLLEPLNMIQIFSDVLSYLRLYALALAGAIIGTIVNEIAGQTNWFLAGLLLIFGHGLNMTLSIMGGVIHGLRLNFIEWYHYCFDGGGKLFRPLKKLEQQN
jgi:V/A-type H+/Na+-transporting ATPase subunit I